MININLRDYDNWYVLQTISRRESQMKDKINRLFNNYFNMLIPLKELLHTKSGNLVKTIYPLLPGYIFLHNEIHTFIEEMVNIKLRQFVKPVCFNDKPAKIKPEEMQYLHSITNEHGIVPLSKGIFYQGDNVEILSGPLKNLNGTIIFINKKKFKAKVRVKLFNREIDTLYYAFYQTNSLPASGYYWSIYNTTSPATASYLLNYADDGDIGSSYKSEYEIYNVLLRFDN